MIAPDQTVTRVGQNTVFSFSRNSREVELQKGSILFQSPSGQGGGTIRTPAASAAVLGTTIIVTATSNGGFKVLVVEGKGRVRGAGGTRILNGGQMMYALPGGKFSGVFEFRLSQQVAASALIRGFKTKLPSSGKIQAAINRQEKEISGGTVIETGLLASGSPSIAYKVDVARDTIVNEELGDALAAATRFQTAATSDATVNTPDLDPTRVFVPEDVDPIEFPGDSRPFALSGDPEDGVIQRASNPAQFIGANILFDTASLSLNPFEGRDVVRFLSLNDIQFNQSLDLGVFSGAVQFWAGGTIQGAEGEAVAIRAVTPNLFFAAFGSEFSTSEPLPENFQAISPNEVFRLSGFTVENGGGNLGFIGGQLDFQGVRFAADTTLHLGAVQDLLISGTSTGPAPLPFSAGPAIPNANISVLAARERVSLRAGRDVDVSQTAIRSPQIRAKAEGNLKLTLVQLDDTSTPPPPNGSSFIPTGERVVLSAQKLADLNKVNFSANDVIIQARTVKLTDVQFRDGSRVVLESAVGQLAPNPNTNRPAVPGFVNFIRGVRYGDGAAEDSVLSPGATSPGIIIRKRSN
jgi:hypothetical protein